MTLRNTVIKKIMTETNIINEKNGKQILTSIFTASQKDQNQFSPILEDSSNISNLLIFLKDKKNSITEKAEIIFILLQLFKVNNILLPLFMRKNIINIINLYEPLIDLYLSKDENINEYKIFLEEFLKMIRNNITLTKAPIEYLFQKMSIYFENKEAEVIERLNESQILKYLNLFKLFYTGGANEKNLLVKTPSIDVIQNKNQNIKEIKNYIYFNGKRSSISLALNQNSINANTDYPTLHYGLSFIMWIYIDKNLIKKYQENNYNSEIKLVVINISGEQIKLVLKDLYILQVSLNDSEVKNIHSTLIKVNDWNNLCFSILEKNNTKLPLKIYINSVCHNTILTISKDFDTNSTINTIKLFENFIGKVTSFMIITKGLEQKEAYYFSNTKKYGFYKNKILFDFILSNEKNYFSNCKNYKYYEKYKSNRPINFYDLQFKKQNVKNMIGIFCPFTYNKYENQIDDIFGNFIGVLGENDGVNYFVNNSKTIRQLGGINNLLPIIELMYSTISKSSKIKYNLLDKSILTQSTFYEYLNLIKNIIIDHDQNLSHVIKSKFFASLSLFIEKLPDNLFTPKILEILLEIGKETFRYAEKFSSSNNYINLILLNEKIISKYNVENQINLWKNIYSFFTSDDTQMKDLFDIKSISLLLRLFDEKRYKEYCCKKHATIFKDNNDDDSDNENNDLPIMEPEMNVRLDELFKIIQIYIDKFCEEEQTANFFKLLSLDLSPCLQKKIILIYVNYFKNKKIELNSKLKSFDFLSKNNFIELIEYVFSISLLDIRVEILCFFKILFDNKELKNRLQKYMGIEDNGMNNFFIFISEYLLPEHLYAELDENKKNDLEEISLDNLLKKKKNSNTIKGLIPLSNYFNKKLYEKEVNTIWNALLKWILYKVPAPPNIVVKKKDKEFNNIHNFVIDFCISFTSKSPFNFIDLFMLTIVSYFKDESIINREILYTNKNLYPWLIETIFNFHNSEYDDIIYKKEDILSIQKNSIDLFQEFFVHRRPHEEINKRIYYIIKYSIHLRKINGDSNNKKITEITRIARLLLQKIMDVSSLHMNYKAKACFDFIIFHKNFRQLTEVKKHITNLNLNKFASDNLMRMSTTVGIPRNFDILNKNKDTSINNNFILDTVEEDIKEKSNDDFNSKKTSSNLASLTLEDANYIKTEDNNNNNIFLNKNNIIPTYIFESLHFSENQEKNSKKNEEENKGKNLKLIWEDFTLYDNIIDYYSSNVWGTENLGKKVKIDIDANIMSFCKSLIKQYGENKSYRNILIKDILKCFNIKYSETSTKAEKVKINILHINIILLCIAIEITEDYYERVFLEGKLQQFIIFCIMASININPNGIYHDLIQDNLYDVLGFAFIFLKKRDKNKYDEYINNLILPIIDTEEEKKFKLFKNKKSANKNSAIFRLFELRENKKEELKELELFYSKSDKKDLGVSRNTVNIIYKKYDTDYSINDNQFKDDSILNNKKSINLKPIFKGDNDLILKHLFDDTLKKLKEERKYNFPFKTNYKNTYNNNYYFGSSPSDEKLRINKVIKKIIPLYETQIKNYDNYEYLHQKNRKNNYKKNQAKLFSWKGFWSNKYLFYEHPEFLKLKVKNHYTKEMIKPLLVPILDLDYYSPPFKKFDKSKLFKKDNYFYKINLDIDDILLDESEIDNNINNQNENNKDLIENNIIIENKNENDGFKIVKNKYGFNFLECLYKFSYNELWDKYKLFLNQKINFQQLIALNKEPYSTLINSKKMSKNIENIQRENIYNCCMVKLTHHIRGYISTEKYRIRFIFVSDTDIKEEELENDQNYDKDMHCCFGSIFKNKKNDKDKVAISIEYSNIKYIFIRQYFYVETALEIFEDNNKSYFFNFKSNRDLDQFKSDILHHGAYREIKAEDNKNKKIIGYQQINPNSKKKTYTVNNKMEEWQNNNISTLEYLMWLNIYSSRSFNDLTQYPVFPWIITNYTDESNEISIKKDLRNLSLPIGMLELTEKGILRKETFIETYETLKNDLKEMFPDFNYQDYLKKGEDYLENYKNKKLKKDNSEEITTIEFNQIPYFYGSHYSNPTYVCHFLSRTFPFTYITIEIQGQTFDDPDRMFTSMEKTFISTSSLKDDVRELIPEFYILPELFLNLNNLNLDQNRTDVDNNLIVINDVKLPLWSNNNAINFVLKLRRYLEGDYINNNINKWIDLIFGVIQRGEKAEENHNIFQAHCYEKNVKIGSIKDIDSRNALMRQYEMGVTPFQIFESESKCKMKNNQIITLDESKNIIFKTMNLAKFKSLKNKEYENHKFASDKLYKEDNLTYLKISKISFIDNDKLKIFTNKNQWCTIKLETDEITNSNNNILKIEESNFNNYSNNSTKYACSYMISDIEIPIIVYNDNQNIIKGGFWDGRLELNITNIDNREDQLLQSQTFFNPDYSPITTMEIPKSEKLLFCGTKDGILIYYKLNEKTLEYKRSLYLFEDEITSISINETLNMFAVSSKDGFINLHILPTFILVRTIYLNKNNKKENNILYADKIFLSSSPIACITLYISSKKIFQSFTINGEFICEINESDSSSKIKSPIVYTNNNFQDILIYGTNDGFVKIRKFPEMALINCIEVFPGNEINTISLSPDKKYCFVWGSEDAISVLKDSDINKNSCKENDEL